MFKSLVMTFGSGLIFSVFAIVVDSPFNSTLTLETLAQSLIGSGFSISNTTITGDSEGIGTYSDATVENQGNSNLEQGLAFSTGAVSVLNNPTNLVDNWCSSSGEFAGDSDLDRLLLTKYSYDEDNLIKTFDAISFEFDFTLNSGTAADISMFYVFGSDEYEEYVVDLHDDLFAIFLDGENIAEVPGSDDFISVCNVNQDINTQYYNSNILSDNLSCYPTEMDGFTTPLTSTFSVEAGSTHHLKVVLANTGDNAQDAWLLISGSNNLITNDVPEPSTYCLIFLSILLLVVLKNGYCIKQPKLPFKR